MTLPGHVHRRPDRPALHLEGTPASARFRAVLVLRNRIFRLALAFIALLPPRSAYGIARALGRIRGRLLSEGLRARPDVAQALGASAADRREWARHASAIRACDDLDMHYLPRMKGKTRRLLEIEGLDNLEHALAGGKGAILFSGHIRRSQLFFAALAELGHPSAIVGFRRRRDEVVAREFGCRCIWMRAGNFGAAVKTANVLRHNGVVVMLIDQPHEGTAMDARFLGRRSQFTFGPALVAQTTGAPMLDFYVYREERWVPQVGVIGAPFWADGSLEEAVQLCASRFEERVRRYPAQWQGTVARS